MPVDFKPIEKTKSKIDFKPVDTKPENITLPDGSIQSSLYKGGERKDSLMFNAPELVSKYVDPIRNKLSDWASKYPIPSGIPGLIGREDLAVLGSLLSEGPRNALEMGAQPESVVGALKIGETPKVKVPEAKPRVRLTSEGAVINPRTGEVIKEAPKVYSPAGADVSERFKSPEGKRLLELTRKATDGEITAEELAEAQKLNKLVRGVDPLPSQASKAQTKRTEAPRIRTSNPTVGRVILDEVSNQPSVTIGNIPPNIPTEGAVIPEGPKIPRATFTDYANIPKGIQAGLDLSYQGRQGLWMIGRPSWWTSWKPSVKALFSEDASNAAQAAIAQHPRFNQAIESGLELRDFNPSLLPEGLDAKLAEKLSGTEEQFGTKFAQTGEKLGKYTGMRASNRAYSTANNHIRMGVFDDIMTAAEKSGKTIDPKDVATYVNTGTGRGTMGLRIGSKSEKMERAASALNTIFWSPRNVTSRFQLINPLSYTKMDPVLRKEALRDLVSATVASGAILGGAKKMGADIDLDPTSTNFGKMKVGKVHVDMTGGFGPIIRFTAQGINHVQDSIKKTGTDEKVAEGPDVMRFTESKLSPTVSALKEIYSGKDYIKKDITVPESALKLVTPMIVKDMYDLYQEDPKLFPFTAAAVVGGGVQVYGEEDNKKKFAVPKVKAPEFKVPKMKFF